MDLALAYGNLGLLENKMGNAESAAARIARAVELQEQLLGAAPDNPQRLGNLAVTLNDLGALYAERQPAKAIEPYEKAVAMQKKAVELRPEAPVYRSELAVTYINLGAAQSRSGATAQAAESYAKVVDLAGELVRQSPAQKSYRHTLAVGFNNLGEIQRKLGHAAAAELSFRNALALQEALVKQDPGDVDQQSALGLMYNDLGTVLEDLNRSADAVNAYEQAVAHQQQAVASAPQIARYRQFLEKHYINYGRALRKIGAPPTPPGPPWRDANIRIEGTFPWPNTDDDLRRHHETCVRSQRRGCAWNAWKRAARSRRSRLPLLPLAPPPLFAAAGEFSRGGGQHLARAILQDVMPSAAGMLRPNPTLAPDQRAPLAGDSSYEPPYAGDRLGEPARRA